VTLLTILLLQLNNTYSPTIKVVTIVARAETKIQQSEARLSLRLQSKEKRNQ